MPYSNPVSLAKHRSKKKGEKGFTLVELAIVLVIIGLIIGGVLVGQDLIKAAEVRATIAQIESYNAAVNTFRNRFNGLPGDLRNAQSFFDSTTWTDVRNGNGNRQLQQCNAEGATCDDPADLEAIGTAGVYVYNGETMQFWHHLSAAELVGGAFNGLGYDSGNDQSATLEFSFPRSRMDRNGVGVYASGGRNFYQIGVVSGADAFQNEYHVAPSLSPEESFNIDGKIDDGRPNSGSVIARNAIGASGRTVPVDGEVLAADGNGICIEEVITGTNTTAQLRVMNYALNNPEVTCSLRFRMN